MKKSSWRTTLGGILVALGQGFQAVKPVGEMSDTIGQLATLIGALVLGLSARDNNVTSEAAGAKS